MNPIYFDGTGVGIILGDENIHYQDSPATLTGVGPIDFTLPVGSTVADILGLH